MIIRNLEYLEIVTEEEQIEGGYKGKKFQIGVAASVSTSIDVDVKASLRGFGVAAAYGSAVAGAINFGGPAFAFTSTNAVANVT